MRIRPHAKRWLAPGCTLRGVFVSRVFARYLVFQIPGLFIAGVVLLLLVRWTSLTEPLAWGLFALWIAKDLALFPLTRIAYETHTSNHGAEAMLGARGTTVAALAPGAPGAVRVGAERWKAQLVEGAPPLPEGAAVRVVAVHGLTLRVEPLEA